MRKLRLTAALGDYDRTSMLSRGKISPEGIDLQVIHLSPVDIFYRMCNFLEFHISEMSMGAHCHLLGAGQSPFIGMPAFPSRAFRHSMIYYNVRSGIQKPEDLNGKRIAIREWGMTASIWMIGILMEEYGLDPTSIEWIAAKKPRVDIDFPPDVHIRYMNAGQDLSLMLDRAEVDAALLHQVPACFASGSAHVKRLFPNYRSAEIDYYKRTGIHPIMHCVVVRKDVYKENPWVLRSVYDALVEAKKNAMEALRDEGAYSTMIPLLPSVMEEMREIFGTDFWPYGVKANQATLEKLVIFAYKQGISSRLLSVYELFGESVRDL